MPRPRPYRIRALVAGALGVCLAAPATAALADVPPKPTWVAESRARTAAADDPPISNAKVVVPMVFPVRGGASYTDTWLACRDGCTRRHIGQDLMAAKMTPLLAADNGVVTSLKRESYVGEGNYLAIRTDTGWTFNYLHINNDTPGTDDGRGTASYAFAPGIAVGVRVVRGQLVAYVGDSGNAEATAPHCHFELHQGDAWSGTVYNPIYSLDPARRLSAATYPSGPHADGTLMQVGTTGAYTVAGPGMTKRIISPTVFAANGYRTSNVIHISVDENYAFRTIGYLPPRDGVVGRDPHGALWVVQHGSRVRVSAVDLDRLAVEPARVSALTDADLALLPVSTASVPSRWRDGTMVRIDNHSEVWYVDGGQRHHIPDATTLWTYGWAYGSWRVLPDDADRAQAPPVGADLRLRDGTLVRSPMGRVGQVSAGAFRWLPSWSIGHLYALDTVPLVTMGTTAAHLPEGRPLP